MSGGEAVAAAGLPSAWRQDRARGNQTREKRAFDAAIAAAKAGIEGLALSAAATHAPKGIRVNCVAPGLTRTPLTARLWQQEAAAKASASLHALGRIGEPEEVASAIDWLLDTEQAWVTGQVLGVDGGLSRVRSRA